VNKPRTAYLVLIATALTFVVIGLGMAVSHS
jgi:hypothetical protein